MSAPSNAPPPAPTHAQLFLHFTWAGVRGFGGVFVMGRRMLVEETRWLTPDEFIEVLGLCQFMPGPTSSTFRWWWARAIAAGPGPWRRSAASCSRPVLIAVGLAAAYERFSSRADRGPCHGALAPAAAGLVLGSAIKMARRFWPAIGFWPCRWAWAC